MNAILSDGFTSIQSFPEKQDRSRTVVIQHDQRGHAPIFTTGHDYARNESAADSEVPLICAPFYILGHIVLACSDLHRRWRYE